MITLTKTSNGKPTGRPLKSLSLQSMNWITFQVEEEKSYIPVWNFNLHPTLPQEGSFAIY